MRNETSRSRKTAPRSQPEALAPASSLLVHDIKNLSFRLGALLENLHAHYDDPVFKMSVLEILSDTVEKMDLMVRRFRERRDGVIIKYPVDLNDILDRILGQIPERERANHGIFVQVRCGRIPKIWGDPDFLAEAFAILIQNGLEAIDTGEGTLTIATRASKAGTGRRRVTVRITDTGCGMEPAFVRKRLFTPFATTKRHGLGMGLYACRRIIDLHDGVIRVRSRPGRGTTFRIAFDAA